MELLQYDLSTVSHVDDLQYCCDQTFTRKENFFIIVPLFKVDFYDNFS